MKRLRILIPVLLIVFLLTGCVWFLPFLPALMADPESEPAPTELPVGTEIAPHLSAEDIYWRSKLAHMDRAHSYTSTLSIQVQYSDGEISFPVDLQTESQVMLDPDASAVNVLTTATYNIDYEWSQDSYEEYYRDEDGKLIYYYYEDATGYCSREEIELDGYTPYVIILDYTIYGYPYPQPEQISMEPQTRLLDEREVYVLTFEQPVGNLLGYTGNAVYDAKLEQRTVPTTWYVDAQTYETVQQTTSLTQIDDLIGSMLQSLFGLESTAEETYTITGFSCTVDRYDFEPVELPEIPQEVLEKAWENAGFSAT